MLLKSADEKSKRVALLEDLQKSQLLDHTQKKWLREELVRFTEGIQGERDAAHYLDNFFKDGENSVLLHDLRFDVDGEVAQIDHLIINSNQYWRRALFPACNRVHAKNIRGRTLSPCSAGTQGLVCLAAAGLRSDT
jgi:hypothetical protein